MALFSCAGFDATDRPDARSKGVNPPQPVASVKVPWGRLSRLCHLEKESGGWFLSGSVIRE